MERGKYILRQLSLLLRVREAIERTHDFRYRALLRRVEYNTLERIEYARNAIDPRATILRAEVDSVIGRVQ